MDELTSRSALELAGLVAKREVSCAEVVDAHLARIEAVNGAVNAVVRLLADSARAEAAGLDRQLADGEPVGPLAGVPITVKENIDMAGLPTTWGVQALAQAVAAADAPVVERMRAAGAIPIGRTNLPDMALRLHTESTLHGATVNPWDAGRTTGGSSGGDAAALATGMAALGLGNDIGGSLRSPASCCGIASIRPSIGRVPDAGSVEAHALIIWELFCVQGPMARRVADVRAALEVLAGAHPRDPWSVTIPFEVVTPAPIRVAMVPEPPGGATDPAVAAAVRTAGQRLAEAGYAVEEITPPRYADAIEVWTQLLLGDFASVLPLLQSVMGGPGLTFLEAVFAAVPPPSDTAGMSAAFIARHGVGQAWTGFLAEWPLILSPTWSQLPFAPGFDAASPENAMAVMELFRPVLPANLMGLPSVCVPAVHDDASGLPIGVLLTGARYNDALCLDAAEVIEAGSPVRTPIDPVSA